MTIKRLSIDYDTEDKSIDIHSNGFNIIYGNVYERHGLLCNCTENKEKYDKIMQLMDEIADRVREVYKINCGEEDVIDEQSAN